MKTFRSLAFTTSKRTAVLTTTVVLSSLVLAGCSGDADEPEAQGSSEQASDDGTESADAGSGVITPADLPEEPEFSKRPKGVIGDIEVDSCDTAPGEVTASGTATNSGKFTRDIVIVMNWTVGTGDVVGRGVAEVTRLEPGESAEWELSGEVPGDAEATCVPTAQAGQLA